MRTSILFIVIFFVSYGYSCRAESQLYIKLNLHDSSQAFTLLNEVEDIATIKRLKYVYPSRAAKVDNIYQDILHIDKYPKVQIMYNDTFYNYLEGKYDNVRSRLFVINSTGRVVYDAALDSVNVEALAYYTRYNYAAFFEKEFSAESTYNIVSMINGYINYQWFFRRNGFANIKTGVAYDFKLNDSSIAEMYRILYDTAFAEKFPFVNEYIRENRAHLPKVESTYYIDSTKEVLVKYKLYDILKSTNSDSIFIRGFPVLVKFSTETNTVLGIYSIKDEKVLRKKGLYLNDIFHVRNNKLYGFFGKRNSQKHYAPELHRLVINEEEKLIELAEDVITNFYAENYFRTIESMYHYSFTINPDLIVYRYSHSIYDFELDELIDIQMPTSKKGVRIRYEISGAIKNKITGNYHLTYTMGESSIPYLLIVKPSGKVIYNTEIRDAEIISRCAYSLVGPYQLVYFDNGTHRFGLYDL